MWLAQAQMAVLFATTKQRIRAAMDIVARTQHRRYAAANDRAASELIGASSDAGFQVRGLTQR